MARSKLFVSLLAVIGVCTLAGTSFAKKAADPCAFTGNYSFFFWDPVENLSGVGYVSVMPTAGTSCRAGVVLPGGILNCNLDSVAYEDYIESGSVFLETDGEGTMEIETNRSDGVCGTGDNAIELDISVTKGGKTILFGSDGEAKAASGTIPQAGYDYTLTGRMAKCYAPDLVAGSYDARFWEPDGDAVGDCTVVVNGAGLVTGGTCRCNRAGVAYLSEIEGGTYTPGENCQSSTGYLTFFTSSDEVCGVTSTVIVDYAVAAGGTEIFGGCDPNNKFNCAFEGFSM
jgi:hypothetical protein